MVRQLLFRSNIFWLGVQIHVVKFRAGLTNSFFTITAKEPKSCKKGFLGEQSFGAASWQRGLRGVEVPPIIGNPSDRLFVRTGKVETARQFSLDTRGWCLQESVLPRRKLIFNGEEMSWQCLEQVFCECSHIDKDEGGDYAHLRATDNTRGDNLHVEWLELVTQYSRRFLTKSTDKLAAISGLAKKFQEIFREGGHTQETEHIIALFSDKITTVPCSPFGVDEYVAGLWRRAIIPGLAWSVDHDSLLKTGRERHIRHRDSNIPTWSWAAIDGPVTFRHLESNEWKDSEEPGLDCDVTITSLTDEPACVVLTGLLVPVDLAVLHYSDNFDFNNYWWDHRQRGNDTRQKMPCFVRAENLMSQRVLLDIEQPLTIEMGDKKASCWAGGYCTGNAETCCRSNHNTEYACLRLLTFHRTHVRLKRKGLWRLA